MQSMVHDKYRRNVCAGAPIYGRARLILHLGAENRRCRKGRVTEMEEKVYKVMRGAGAMNIAVGVVTLVIGLTSGILLIIGGAKLLAGKSKILF